MRAGLEASACALIVMMMSTGAARADVDKTEAPRFVVLGGVAGVDRLPLAESIYDVDVSGVVAEVHLTQTYVNEGVTTLDAAYVFPLSTRAAVNALTMRIGERTIVARIEERRAARAQFDAAEAAGKHASLLEQERPNVFRMNVANLRPGDVVEVELTYVELLVPDDGHFELVVPAVVAPRYEGADTLPWTLAAPDSLATDMASADSPWNVNVRLSTAVPLQWLDSPSHAIVQSERDDEHVSVALGEVGGHDASDFVLRYALDGDAVDAGVLRYDAADGQRYFLAMVQPPERVTPELIPPREYVFVVDVSGSMEGFPSDTARHLVRELLGRLRATDRFDVLTFAGGSAAFAPQSVAATAANRKAALAFLARTASGGGTELLPALDRALAMPSADGFAKSLVVITDGFVDVEAQAFERVRAMLGKASVFTFGIGFGVNRFLIEGLAHAGCGAAFIAEDAARANEVADDFATYIEAPVLTQVRLDAEGVTLSDMEPREVPDVFADRPIMVIGKYSGDPAAAHITVSGRTGRGAWSKRVSLSAASSAEHAALPYLWARERLARLSDFVGAGEADAHKEEITRIGLAYHLMTAHTSFVAIDDGERREAVNAAQPSADRFVLGQGQGGMGFSGSGSGGGGGISSGSMGLIGDSSGALMGMGVAGPGPIGIGSPSKVTTGAVPSVKLGALKVQAGDASIIRPRILRRLALVARCLAAVQALPASLTATLMLGVDGLVTSVFLAPGLDGVARRCVESALRRTAMPTSPTPVQVELTLLISP